MPYFMATIQVLVETDNEAAACDALAEGLRPMLKEFADDPASTAWVDWRFYAGHSYPVPHNGAGFEYAKPDSVRDALIAAETALAEQQANVGDDPDSIFAGPLAKVRAALAGGTHAG